MLLLVRISLNKNSEPNIYLATESMLFEFYRSYQLSSAAVMCYTQLSEKFSDVANCIRIYTTVYFPENPGPLLRFREEQKAWPLNTDRGIKMIPKCGPGCSAKPTFE